MSEQEIQNDILYYLNTRGDSFAWTNKSQGTYDPHKKTFRKMGGFCIKGVSDIIGIQTTTGKFMAFEVKIPEKKNNTTQEQRAFILKIQNSGGIAAVVTSIEDVKKILCQ